MKKTAFIAIAALLLFFTRMNDVQSARRDTTPPTVPTGLTAVVISSSQINLSWNASTDNVGVAGYKVFRNGSQIATTARTSYTDTGLGASTTYTYAVSAYDAAGNNSARSGAVSATTKAAVAAPPTVPTGLTAVVISSSQINLSWNASTDNVGVARYKVFRNGSQIATTARTSYTDTGLGASTTYTYAVSAYDAAGNNSAQSSPPLSATTAPGPYASAYPVKAGPTGRYLVDQNNVPFMIVGDSPHSLFVNLSEAQADAYFADRQANGFNAAWIEVLCDAYTGGRSDGSTYDGIIPFTTPGDLSTPNQAYFQRVDDMINLAAKHNITVFLDPLDTGGWLSTLVSNGAAKAYNYGLYLGNRYNNFPNVVWLNGNDFQTWTNATNDADVTAVADGIKAGDQNHIQTVELSYNVSSLP